MNIDVEKLTTWSAGREVNTSRGPRLLRKGPLTDAYRSAWRANKAYMRDTLGLSMAPVNRDDPSGAWEAVWWQPINGEVAKARQEAVEASRATDAQIEVPAPDGMAYMPFQRAGIAFMRGKPGVLLADEMGLGKTIQAIGVMNSDPSIKRVLVICPASLKVNWRNELNKWLVRPARVAVQNGGQPWAGAVADVVIINYDILGKFTQVNGETWDLLVVDECHYAKNRSAQRTKLLLGATKKEDREKYPGIRATRRIFATGTPILNRPIELFPILESLQPGTWTFRDKIRYCAGHQDRFGWDFSGHAFEDEFQRRLRETVMVRRLKRDVLTELPAKRRQVIELPAGDADGLCDEEVGLYDQSRDDIESAGADAALADAADDEAAYKSAVERLKKAQKVAFERVAKVRHEVALAKVGQVIEHVSDLLQQVNKVVVFGHHLDVIERMRSELAESDGVGTGTVHVITGATPNADRQPIVDRFNSDPKARVLILGIHAAGVGLSVKASVEVFAELDWVPGIITQAEDRCHGIGRGIEGEPLMVQHLVLEGSLDARMAKIVVAKQAVADRMLDKPLAALQAGEAVTSFDGVDPYTKSGGAAEVSRELHDAVLRGLRILAGKCDGARLKDGCGFNGRDARIGHALAGQESLSPKQVLLGQRVLVKYHGQLPEEVNSVVKGKS